MLVLAGRGMHDTADATKQHDERKEGEPQANRAGRHGVLCLDAAGLLDTERCKAKERIDWRCTQDSLARFCAAVSAQLSAI